MPTDDSLYTPRNLGGMLARIAETPDGGAIIEVWTGDNWEPPPPGAVSFGEIMGARPASDAILARAGVPYPSLLRPYQILNWHFPDNFKIHGEYTKNWPP